MGSAGLRSGFLDLGSWMWYLDSGLLKLGSWFVVALWLGRFWWVYPFLGEREMANHLFSAKRDVEKSVHSILYKVVMSRSMVLQVYVLGS